MWQKFLHGHILPKLMCSELGWFYAYVDKQASYILKVRSFIVLFRYFSDNFFL